MMTIDQVKKDIKSGKCKRIYLSTQTLWWTHLDEDVKDATEVGTKYKLTVEDKILNDPKVNADTKKRIIALRDSLKHLRSDNPAAFLGRVLPLCPVGAPLIQNDYPERFIAQTLMNPKHFGQHGIKAFMQAHHQNTKDYFSNRWIGYNEYINKKSKK